MNDKRTAETPHGCLVPYCKYEDKILDACERLIKAESFIASSTTIWSEQIESIEKTLNKSMEQVEKHVEQGSRWRIAILGIAFALILQVVSFVYMFGRLVESNEQRGKQIDLIMTKLINSSLTVEKSVDTAFIQDLSPNIKMD